MGCWRVHLYSIRYFSFLRIIMFDRPKQQIGISDSFPVMSKMPLHFPLSSILPQHFPAASVLPMMRSVKYSQPDPMFPGFLPPPLPPSPPVSSILPNHFLGSSIPCMPRLIPSMPSPATSIQPTACLASSRSPATASPPPLARVQGLDTRCTNCNTARSRCWCRDLGRHTSDIWQWAVQISHKLHCQTKHRLNVWLQVVSRCVTHATNIRRGPAGLGPLTWGQYYRVSHNIGSTLFFLSYSGVLEHVQRNFWPFFNPCPGYLLHDSHKNFENWFRNSLNNWCQSCHL